MVSILTGGKQENYYEGGDQPPLRSKQNAAEFSGGPPGGASRPSSGNTAEKQKIATVNKLYDQTEGGDLPPMHSKQNAAQFSKFLRAPTSTASPMSSGRNEKMETRSHGAAHGDVEAVGRKGEDMIIKLGAVSVNSQATSSTSVSTTTTIFGRLRELPLTAPPMVASRAAARLASEL